MLKPILFTVLMSTAILSHAALEALNHTQMTDTIGQGGADLNWTLSLNHVYATDLTKNNISRLDSNGNVIEAFYVLDPAACGTTRQFCRLAIAPNNHVDENGNKKWLVFKGLQGTLQIDRFSVDGTTIINAADKPQTAMQISFYDDQPLKIRNLGFSTMSVETGTGTGALEGYANVETYDTFTGLVYQADGTSQSQVQDVPLFDKGTEKGFLGLNMHGNLHMNGNLKIFSYNCSGAVGSRC